MNGKCTEKNPFGFEVGDMAIIESGKEADIKGAYGPGWVADMDEYVGQAHVINYITELENCTFEGIGWTFDLRYVTPIVDDFEINDTEFEEKMSLLFQ